MRKTFRMRRAWIVKDTLAAKMILDEFPGIKFSQCVS